MNLPLAYTNMPSEGSQTIQESRKWYFKYFAKSVSLGASDFCLYLSSSYHPLEVYIAISKPAKNV